MPAFFKNLFPDQSPIRLLYHKVTAMLAAVLYGFPANKMTVIAVTGTNGKTTTVNMIAAILQEAGKKVGVSSSVYFQVGEDRWRNNTKQTTPGRFGLQGLLRQMVDDGCQYAILECTSHAMTQYRFWGINVDTAVLTNVTQDHLEYHGSLENYRAAKGELFKKLNLAPRKPQVQKMAVLNADDEHFAYFERFPVDRSITFSIKGKGTINADVTAFEPGQTRFALRIPNDHIQITLKMPGKVNVMNALAAASVAVVHDVNLHTIKSALEKFTGVPGRLEAIDEGQDFSVIVDYAHTPDALEELGKLFKPLTKGKLIWVFGSTGGGRDKAKRPVMGKVVEEFADMIILTNDDPYTENQIHIIEDIAKGIKRKEGDGLWKIVSRRQAIRLALMMAKKGDTVLITGKGGEQVIVIGEKHVPWNDSQVVREYLGRVEMIEESGQF